MKGFCLGKNSTNYISRIKGSTDRKDNSNKGKIIIKVSLTVDMALELTNSKISNKRFTNLNVL